MATYFLHSSLGQRHCVWGVAPRLLCLVFHKVEVGRAVFLCQGSEDAPASKPIQVAGRIQVPISLLSASWGPPTLPPCAPHGLLQQWSSCVPSHFKPVTASATLPPAAEFCILEGSCNEIGHTWITQQLPVGSSGSFIPSAESFQLCSVACLGDPG